MGRISNRWILYSLQQQGNFSKLNKDIQISYISPKILVQLLREVALSRGLEVKGKRVGRKVRGGDI